MITFASFDKPREPGSVRALQACNIGMCLFGFAIAGGLLSFHEHLLWVSNLAIGWLLLFFPFVSLRLHAILHKLGELEESASMTEGDLRMLIVLGKEAITMALGVEAAFTVALFFAVGWAIHHIKELEVLYNGCLKALGH